MVAGGEGRRFVAALPLRRTMVAEIDKPEMRASKNEIQSRTSRMA
jgi:hypothetical protein